MAILQFSQTFFIEANKEVEKIQEGARVYQFHFSSTEREFRVERIFSRA